MIVFANFINSVSQQFLYFFFKAYAPFGVVSPLKNNDNNWTLNPPIDNFFCSKDKVYLQIIGTKQGWHV